MLIYVILKEDNSKHASMEDFWISVFFNINTNYARAALNDCIVD